MPDSPIQNTYSDQAAGDPFPLREVGRGRGVPLGCFEGALSGLEGALRCEESCTDRHQKDDEEGDDGDQLPQVPRAGGC